MGKYFFREKFFHNVKVIDDIIFKVRSICIKDIWFLTTLGWVRQSRKPLLYFKNNRHQMNGKREVLELEMDIFNFFHFGCSSFVNYPFRSFCFESIVPYMLIKH